MLWNGWAVGKRLPCRLAHAWTGPIMAQWNHLDASSV